MVWHLVNQIFLPSLSYFKTVLAVHAHEFYKMTSRMSLSGFIQTPIGKLIRTETGIY